MAAVLFPAGGIPDLAQREEVLRQLEVGLEDEMVDEGLVDEIVDEGLEDEIVDEGLEEEGEDEDEGPRTGGRGPDLVWQDFDFGTIELFQDSNILSTGFVVTSGKLSNIETYHCKYMRKKGYSCKVKMRVTYSESSDQIEVQQEGGDHDHAENIHYKRKAEAQSKLVLTGVMNEPLLTVVKRLLKEEFPDGKMPSARRGSPPPAILTTPLVLAPLIALDFVIHCLLLTYAMCYQVFLFFLYIGMFLFCRAIGDRSKLEKTGKLEVLEQDEEDEEQEEDDNEVFNDQTKAHAKLWEKLEGDEFAQAESNDDIVTQITGPRPFESPLPSKQGHRDEVDLRLLLILLHAPLFVYLTS